jgi:hypothetical protein
MYERVSLKPVGVSFNNLDNVKLGARAWLNPEPENEFDENAVAVIVNGKPVGYVARSEQSKVKSAVTDMFKVTDVYTDRKGNVISLKIANY